MEQDAVTKIQQRLAELPADVQAAIRSSDLHAKVVAIGGKYQLHIDQVGELEDEIMLAMLGFAPLESLGRRLSDTLRLAPDVGEKLSADINTELFGAIRESMKKFAATKTAAANPTPAATAPTAVATPAPAAAAATPAPASAPAAKPPVSPDMHKADVVLAQPTVSMPPKQVPAAPATSATPAAAASTPPIYKADPYREPI